jgi:hypothetical protein
MLAVAAAATPIAVRVRGLFLEEVARAIARQPEVGDGSLYRLIARIQRKYYDPDRLTDDRRNVGRRVMWA